MKQGRCLEKVWQQRGQALDPSHEWNPVHSYFASNCNMNMAASLFSASLQKFSFHQNLLRDLYLPKEDWRGHGFGKCTWSSFKWNRLKYSLVKGLSKGFARLVTQRLCCVSSDTLPCAGLYIYDHVLGHLPSKKIKICLEVEA